MLAIGETTSNQPRLLLVEDPADDAELLLPELRRGGYEVLARKVREVLDAPRGSTS